MASHWTQVVTQPHGAVYPICMCAYDNIIVVRTVRRIYAWEFRVDHRLYQCLRRWRLLFDVGRTLSFAHCFGLSFFFCEGYMRLPSHDVQRDR